VATASSVIRLTPARVYEYYWTSYKRTWRASIASQFLNPVLFLLAMGVGLGSLVNKGHAAGAQGSLPHGVTYLAFLAPGLLAASAMQTAAMECTYPVMAAVKWLKTYFGMIATPVAVVGIVIGHLTWVATRLAMVATIFLAVMACFGTIHSPLAVLALPAAVLCGLAFAAPIAAFAATRESDSGFAALFRFGIVPMFLFSGVFFPVSQLPVGLRPVAWITPLWHGVDLCRSLTLGTAGAAASIGHAAYLIAWTLVGAAIAVRTHRKRLVV
jgi:lipooligosaccharide transport system permease protein